MSKGANEVLDRHGTSNQVDGRGIPGCAAIAAQNASDSAS
jgi:hypothetical protein